MPTERTPLLPRHPSAMDASEASRQRAATVVILLVLILERLSYYALATNFYLFLNKGPWDGHDTHWDDLSAMNAVLVLAGVSYISALLGGYLSDAWLGRFKTMVIGFVFYILGYILLTLLTIDVLPRNICLNGDNESSSGSPSPCAFPVFSAVIVVGLGVGIVKSNIAPFGAEQLRTANPQRTRLFFNWFYWCINVGSLIGVGVLSYVEQDNPGLCKNGFFCGYLISTICLCIAFVLFVSVYPCYYIAPIEGSVLGNVGRIVWESCRAQIKHWRNRPTNLNPLHLEPRFLDRAKLRFGGSFQEAAVDDVRSLGSLLVVFMYLIPYWLVYFQMETSFQAQGLHMQFEFNTTKFETSKIDISNLEIPTAWLTLFNQIFLIVAIPLLANFLYPRLDRQGIRLSLLVRIGLGMLFSCLAVMTAGGLESFRLSAWNDNTTNHRINQTIGNSTYQAVDISIFAQVPQYILVGAAEAFASIAGLEYAYSASPRSYQGMIMGLFYTMEGIGSFLGIALLKMVSPFWFSNQNDFKNINYNHLDFYFYFLGCIQFTVAVLFSGFLYMQRFSLRPIAFPRQRNAEQRRVMVDADSDGWRDRDEVRQRGLSASIEEEDENSNGEDNDSDDGAINESQQLL